MTIISYEKEIAKKKEHLFVPSVMIPAYSRLQVTRMRRLIFQNNMTIIRSEIK